jgi:hypothetical protein
VAEWFKAPVLKTGRGFTLPRGFESHPFRQVTLKSLNFSTFFEPATGINPLGYESVKQCAPGTIWGDMNFVRGDDHLKEVEC